MATVVDYSFARPGGGVIAAAGHAGVVRYLAPINAQTKAKLLTPGEVTDLRFHGLSIALVWEGGSSRALAGSPAGIGDSAEANRQADVLGAPADAAIYYAVDSDLDPAKVTDYFRGLRLTTRRPVGVYGSFRVVEAVLDAGLAVLGWQTSAWSAGQRSTKAALFQRPGSSNVPGTDVNDCLRGDWGQWPRPGVTKEENGPMTKLYRFDGNPQVWEVGELARPVSDPDDRDGLRIAGVAASNPAAGDGVFVIPNTNVGTWLRQKIAFTQSLAAPTVDVAVLADALVAQLPAGGAVDPQALAKAVVAELAAAAATLTR